MTFFIKLENGQPVGNAIAEDNLKQVLAGIDFPAVVTSAFIEQFGYGIYDFSNQPECGKYQKVVEIAPVRNEFGIWRQTWQLVDMNDEEKAAEDAAKAGQMRSYRNSLLAQSDWTQVADAPVDKAVWATHRQALRDITAQQGFPWTVTWPEAP
jgi:hypothetical protein